jgi:hypothetical protein
VVTIALVIVALGEMLILLILLVGSSLHRVVEIYDSLGAAAPEVTVDVL